MPKGKYERHPGGQAPIGTTHIRRGEGSRGDKACRVIKVRLDGPQHERWVAYARVLWEAHHGSVPPGRRVIHKDGDLLNDHVDNLVLGTAADVVCLWHQREPRLSRRNHRKCARAMAAHNRLRGHVNRALHWLPTYWYPVFPAGAGSQVWNEPRRTRAQALRLCGVTGRWQTLRSAGVGWPDQPLLDACVLAVLEPRRGKYARLEELREAVSRFRRAAGWRPPNRGTLQASVSRLKGTGLVDGPRGRYGYSGLAELHRARRSPVLALRGARLATDTELFESLRKVDRLDGICRRCGCTEDNACWDEELGACSWVEPDLCAHCLEGAR
jgi:hypothetical protein